MNTLATTGARHWMTSTQLDTNPRASVENPRCRGLRP